MKMTPAVLLFILLLLLSSAPTSSSPLLQGVCDKTFCGAGRECVSTERGEPICRCVQTCDQSEHWVCGSNGRSYTNHCELHRDACLTHTKIHLAHSGRCSEMQMETSVSPKMQMETSVSPIVCLLSDRDWLRSSVIHWIQKEAETGSLASNGSSVSNLLHKYFQVYDHGDAQLDSTEFLSFLKHNKSSLNLTHSSNLENNLLLRSLCVDALIELSDEDADWKLSLTEFTNCLTASYQPPERKCALEDEVFEDGSETQMECNRCVCACGNWVCTALTCDGDQQVGEVEMDGGEEEEMTEEEWSQRVAELNALQETVAMET